MLSKLLGIQLLLVVHPVLEMGAPSTDVTRVGLVAAPVLVGELVARHVHVPRHLPTRRLQLQYLVLTYLVVVQKVLRQREALVTLLFAEDISLTG